jgi:hypothetical protein
MIGGFLDGAPTKGDVHHCHRWIRCRMVAATTALEMIGPIPGTVIKRWQANRK